MRALSFVRRQLYRAPVALLIASVIFITFAFETLAGPRLEATKQLVDLNGGDLLVGDEVEYIITIRNSGDALQPDNPGDEFRDSLPPQSSYIPGSLRVEEVLVNDDPADGIGFDPAPKPAGRIIWNGALSAGQKAKLSFRVRIGLNVGTGQLLVNQGVLFFDPELDGTNGTIEPTDDPRTPEMLDPTRALVIHKGDVAGRRGRFNLGDGAVDCEHQEGWASGGDCRWAGEIALQIGRSTAAQRLAADVVADCGVVNALDVVWIDEASRGLQQVSRAACTGSSPVPQGMLVLSLGVLVALGLRWRVMAISVLLLLSVYGLSGCGLLGVLPTPPARASLSLETAQLQEHQKKTVAISIMNFAIKYLQVGPRSALQFDPKVVRVKQIRGAGDVIVYAAKIDNRAGQAQFIAGVPGPRLAGGPLVWIELEAIGRPGTSSVLDLTLPDLLADARSLTLKELSISPGRITIQR